MYQNCCKKCGSVSLYTEQKGNNIGLYCSDCGAWIKWLGKDEARAFEHSQAPTPIDWSSVKPLPPVEDAETFSPMKNGDYIELCDVKTGARYMAKIIDVKIKD